MGGSSSSLLDESKCTYIRGKTEAVIKNLSPHYKRQYAVCFCKHIQNELEQSRDLQSQFLKTKPLTESFMNFYEGELSHFAEDLKKWKDRYVVIKNNYAVEIFENKEAFQKGIGSKNCILPVGGKVLTTEEDYNLLSDKHFPDPNASNEKESAQAFVVFPKEFPVCLWQPFLRHSYFCFLDPESQKQFSTVLNDCIRHLNHDFFKQASFEAEAFLEAVQFFRQEKGQYGSWEMITGNEVQILSNLVLEELLPNLQTMLLPKMKGKRNDRKRAWFGILEDTYHLVQDQVSEGLHTLKEECREVTKGLEGTIRSDMDQILTSKNFVAGKINESVSEPAQKCCGEIIQPFLASILEELMGPVSSGFSEVRLLFDKEVNEINQNFQATNDTTKLKEDVKELTCLPYNSVKMDPCYQKVILLQEQLQDLKSRFKFYNIDLVIQRTQNLMQELMENAVYTFEQLLGLSNRRDVAKMATVIEKVKLRVLKQYDYDSSTVRKKIFQDALVQITLPTLQRTLASTCKPELQKYEQYIFADHTTMIQVENVYEEILLQTLLDEIQKVIKEAAHLKKHNLFEETNLPSMSVSSLSDLKTPSGSAQTSPARKPAASVTEVSDTDTQSSEVFTSPKITLEECLETRKMLDNEGGIFPPTNAKEEESVSDLGSNQESCPVILKAVEEKMAQHVEERSLGGNIRAENEVQVEEKKLPDPDSVDEIRNLLTVTVEIPADVPSKSTGEVVHRCEISRPQDCAGDQDKEDNVQAEECQMHEMPETPKVHFPPNIEAGDTDVTSISFSPSVEMNNRNVTSTSIPASSGDINVHVFFPQDSETDYINIPSISSPSTEADYINVSNISSLSTDADYINVSSTSFLPSTEADKRKVTSISGEEKCITQVNSPEVSEEPDLCQASKAELETVTSIWYTDGESRSPIDQSQTKQPAESEQSDWQKIGFSPFSSVLAEDKLQVELQTESGQFDLREVCLAPQHPDPVNEESQMEQDANSGESDQRKEAVYIPHSIPAFDNSQTDDGSGKSDMQEAGLFSLHTVLTEVDTQSCSGSSLLEAQELISNISNLTIEPADLIISSEGKENEDSSLETPMKVIFKGFALAEQEDSKQPGVSLLSADVASMTEGETSTVEKAEGNCPKSPSEK